MASRLPADQENLKSLQHCNAGSD